MGFLAGRINDLAEGGLLKPAHAKALTNKLRSAIKQMDRGNLQAARDQLMALVEQVEALRDEGHIGPPDADQIIGMAWQIIGMITAML
jgi:hypothetical protein